VVEELSKGIVNKLLHGPMTALRCDGADPTAVSGERRAVFWTCFCRGRFRPAGRGLACGMGRLQARQSPPQSPKPFPRSMP
jgi:hypothetical protein